MREVELTEQLDQAIDAMMSTGVTPAAVDEQIADLLPIALELRDLPRADFKARLLEELEKEAEVSTAARAVQKKVNPVREGFRTITPYLVVPDVQAEAEFLKQTFGVTGPVFGLGSQGGFHAEYNIGGSMIMVGGGGAGSQWQGTPQPAYIHLYVDDVDAIYDSAVRAGATNVHPPVDQFYGDRECGFRDPGGNQWFVATHQGESFVPAGRPNLMPSLQPIGAPKMIDFLKQAFGAEEFDVYRSPDGAIRHASIRVGTSIVEMGEAHGQWQPMPAVFMMYVEDVDAWYERAIKAEGAVAKDPPKLQPHGARMGSIKDPFDNVWYIASQVQKAGGPPPEERTTMGAPRMFRVALQVGDLAAAGAFYSQLLEDPGIPIPRGSRHYFNCGAMILALVDVTAGGEKPQPMPDYVYFAVNNLEEIFARAQALDCLCKDRYHDQQAGEIVKRPWGEVSFYVEDPWGNGLCFVDETTLFTGR
ncbi:MAG TPA: VOC family protein [Pyrinomonadaceae bacterium]|nr:VOC family protein [Pyrinomonadaceae bacterium]